METRFRDSCRFQHSRPHLRGAGASVHPRAATIPRRVQIEWDPNGAPLLSVWPLGSTDRGLQNPLADQQLFFYRWTHTASHESHHVSKGPSKHLPARLRAANEPRRAAIGRLASELVEKGSRPRVVLRCCHFPLAAEPDWRSGGAAAAVGRSGGDSPDVDSGHL